MFPQWVGEKVYVGASESLGVEGNLTSAMTQGNAVKAFRISETPFLVSLDVEINPRFYRGKKKERSDKKVGRAWCEPKDF